MSATKAQPSDQEILTVLKMLAGGRDLAFAVSANQHLTGEQIRQIAQAHGYPDTDKLRWAVGVLSKKIDTDAVTNFHNGATPSRPIPATPVAPAPVAPNPAPAGRPFDATAALLLRGKESSRGRTRALSEKISTLLADLRDRLDAEAAADRAAKAAEAERLAAIEEVRKLEAELTTARQKLRRFKNHRGGNGSAHVVPVTDAVASTRAAGGKATSRDLGYDARTIRVWARENNIPCPARGRYLPAAVVQAWREATA